MKYIVECKECGKEVTVVKYTSSLYFFCPGCKVGEEVFFDQIRDYFESGKMRAEDGDGNVVDYKEPMEEW